MKVYNKLPLLLDCLRRWHERPSEAAFNAEFALPMQEVAGDFFTGFYDVLLDLNWSLYRSEALRLDSEREEQRFLQHLKNVEKLFGFKLQGEVILMGGFAELDGYARFDRGTHKVFLGVDESHGRGRYMDILTVHELTHVARESRPEVWLGFGLNPTMTQNEFTDQQPVIEHLMGEGFSCAVSELLVPDSEPWHYAYQSEEDLSQILSRGSVLDRIIQNEILNPDGDYGRLYSIRPLFSHYVWAWQWAKTLLKKYANGDPKKIVSTCSKDFIEDALAFELRSLR